MSDLKGVRNSMFRDLNIKEVVNLLRNFGDWFEKDRSPYKLSRRRCKYGFLRASLDVLILLT